MEQWPIGGYLLVFGTVEGVRVKRVHNIGMLKTGIDIANVKGQIQAPCFVHGFRVSQGNVPGRF